MSQSVVITGSTHGIGFSLAAAFLAHGCHVTISGRSQASVDGALDKLRSRYSQELIFSIPCDVTDFAQVQRLWEETAHYFGKIDIWINNAGIAAPAMDFWELPPDLTDEVVRTNLIGTLYGTKVAVKGMLAQGYGAVYNMEGYGARGQAMHGFALYGSTKASAHFFDKALSQELRGTPVILGAISPGMVITEMITRQYTGHETELEKVKPILNILAERPETVAPVLVDKILRNHKNGVTINFSSPVRILWRFITASFHKRDLFSPA